MTSILKKQLTALCGVAVLGGALMWTGGPLRAQGKHGPWPKLTRDETAKGFVALMKLPDPRAKFHFGEALESSPHGVISHKSEILLGYSEEKLIYDMAKQWQQPVQEVKVQSEDDRSATVTVEDSSLAANLPLVLIKEGDRWGVDLIETYAKWNHLDTVAKARAIFQLTGVELEGLPHDTEFQETQCQLNLKQMGLGLLQYTQDYDEKFPLAKTWADGVEPYIKSRAIYNCPALPEGHPYGYAFNSQLSSKFLGVVDASGATVALYEIGALKNNAYGTGQNLAFRHEGQSNFGFVDGHVSMVRPPSKPSFNLKQ